MHSIFRKKDDLCPNETRELICGGVPKPGALFALLEENQIDPKNMGYLAHRGCQWPGSFSAELKDGGVFTMPYHEAWGRHLSKQRSIRHTLCDDPFSLCADIVVGGPWGEEYKAEKEGLSLVLVRTRAGLDAFDGRGDCFAAEPAPQESFTACRRAFM